MEKRIKINNQDKWNYCNCFVLLPLLGVNHRLTLLHRSNKFVYFNNTEERIHEFTIRYVVNPTLSLGNENHAISVFW